MTDLDSAVLLSENYQQIYSVDWIKAIGKTIGPLSFD